MRKVFGNKLLRSHFYNFCSTDYLGHAIHRTSMGSACICSYRNCGCNGIFPPVNNHYCARWASLHMYIYIKNPHTTQPPNKYHERYLITPNFQIVLLCFAASSVNSFNDQFSLLSSSILVSTKCHGQHLHVKGMLLNG